MRRFGVIMNQAAGQAASGVQEPALVQIAQLFRHHGAVADVQGVSGPQIAMASRSLIEKGADVIVAAGGDGTISTVASVAFHFKRPLGILPLGTLNHFAKDLEIPLDLSEAVALLVGGDSRAVDVAEVNRRVFINNSSLGAYAGLVEERESLGRFTRNKHLGTTVATLKTLLRRPLVHVRIEFDGRLVYRTTPFVFVGNNLYSVRLRDVGSRPRLDEGLLCIFTARCTGLGCLLRLVWRALCNRLEEAVEFDTWTTTEVRIQTHRRHLRVAIDGEVNRMESPLLYRSRPGALQVFAPPPRLAPNRNPTHDSEK